MITDRLLDEIQPGKILSIQVGMSRTAVLAETEDGIRCGLGSNLFKPG